MPNLAGFDLECFRFYMFQTQLFQLLAVISFGMVVRGDVALNFAQPKTLSG